MTKKILSVFTAFFFIFLFTFASFAEEEATATKNYVIDLADVLTDEDEQRISESIVEAIEDCKMDIVVVTVEDLEGKSTMEYADDYYDYNGYDEDGVLYLLHVEDGIYSRGNSWISTSGKAIDAIHDDDIQDIGSDITPDLLEGNYTAAILEYVSQAHSLIKQSTSINFKKMAAWAIIVGVIVMVIVNNILKGQLKSVKEATDASNYIVDGSISVLGSYDHFLYSTVTSTKRQNSSSSGSSTHTSSSGNTHGGGRF